MTGTPIDFSAFIAEPTRNFTGCERVFSEIGRWLADPVAPRHFFITEEPGIGKTALVAAMPWGLIAVYTDYAGSLSNPLSMAVTT